MTVKDLDSIISGIDVNHVRFLFGYSNMIRPLVPDDAEVLSITPSFLSGRGKIPILNIEVSIPGL